MALVELRSHHRVAVRRGLTSTEILEVAEDLAHTTEQVRGILEDNRGDMRHAATAAVTDPLVKVAEEFSALAGDLLKAHGEYRVDDQTFPCMEPLRNAMERAYLAASDRDVATQQQADEVTGHLTDILDMVASIGDVIARQSQPQGGRWWQIAEALTDVGSALRNCSPQPAVGQSHPPTLPRGQQEQVCGRDGPPFVAGHTGSTPRSPSAPSQPTSE